MKARWLWLVVPLMAASCKNDPAPPSQGGDGHPPGEGIGLSACLDQPTTLVTPPSGQLPCELLPPGFSR